MVNLFSGFTTSTYNNSDTFSVEPSSTVSTLNSATRSIVSLSRMMGYILGLCLIATAVILLVIAMSDRKKINQEVSEKTINKVKFTSILLLIINIISCNLLGFVGAILAIIALVTTGKAKQFLSVDLVQAKEKAKLATTLNIITAVLIPVSVFVLLAGLVMLNTITDMTATIMY